MSENKRVHWSLEDLQLLKDLMEKMPGPGGQPPVKVLLDKPSVRDKDSMSIEFCLRWPISAGGTR